MARALSVVNIHLMRARAVFRCRSQAAISGTRRLRVVDSAIQALSAQDADLDLDHVEPACVLGRVVEFEPAQHAPGFGGRERLIEGAGRVGRQIILHDADVLGIGIMNIDEFAHALGVVLGRAPSVTLTLRQGRCTSRRTKRLTVPLRRYS